MRVSACAFREHRRRSARRVHGAATTRRCLRSRESWQQLKAQHCTALSKGHTVAEACASSDAESSAAPSARCMGRRRAGNARFMERAEVEQAPGIRQRSHTRVVIAGRGMKESSTTHYYSAWHHAQQAGARRSGAAAGGSSSGHQRRVGDSVGRTVVPAWQLQRQPLPKHDRRRRIGGGTHVQVAVLLSGVHSGTDDGQACIDGGPGLHRWRPRRASMQA